MSEAHPIPTNPRFQDLTGQRFGKLTVVSYAGKTGKIGSAAWLCACDCGERKVILARHLKNGNSQTCGCGAREASRKRQYRHGHGGKKRTKEYRVWAHINRRCHVPTDKAHPSYGALGISVFPEWRSPHGFPAFLAYVGPCPSPKHTLDRFPDQNGNYEPGNVRWATMKEQNRNKSSNRMLTLGEETKCMQDWSEITGLSPAAISWRKEQGWSDERALSTPHSRPASKDYPPFTFCG